MKLLRTDLSAKVVVDPDCPAWEGASTAEMGQTLYYLARFSAKNFMKMKEIGPRPRGGGGGTPRGLPLGSINAKCGNYMHDADE